MPLVFVPPQEQGAARLHALRARRVKKVLHSSEQLRSLLCKDRSSKFQHRREERCRQSQAAFEPSLKSTQLGDLVLPELSWSRRINGLSCVFLYHNTLVCKTKCNIDENNRKHKKAMSAWKGLPAMAARTAGQRQGEPRRVPWKKPKFCWKAPQKGYPLFSAGAMADSSQSPKQEEQLWTYLNFEHTWTYFNIHEPSIRMHKIGLNRT